MAANRRDREAKRRATLVQAKKSLRGDQVRRLRRDNLFGGLILVIVIAVAVALQLSVFRYNPTAAQMEKIEHGLTEPSTSQSTSTSPSPSPSSSLHTPPAKVPDPSAAVGKIFIGTIDTNRGKLSVRLNGKRAPQAVAVVTTLAERGFYDGLTCHRLTTGATMGVLQCGSATGDGAADPNFSWGPIENAPDDGHYPAGTIAMARGSGADSQGTQFFIVYKDSTIGSDAAGGYSVIGRVTDGLDIVREVAADGIAPGSENPHDGRPREPVTIDSFHVK